MKRRTFTNRIFSAFAFLGFGSFLSACGDDEPTPDTIADIIDEAVPGCGGDGLAGSVAYGGGTHNHDPINLTAGEITAGVPQDYTLLSGGHAHTFALTASHFADLQAGTPVTLDETTDGLHHHSITIACI